MFQHRILCGSIALLFANFLPACSACDDPVCFNSGFRVSFVNEEGKGVNRGTFKIASVSDATKLEAECTFKEDGDTCPLEAAEDTEGTVKAEAKAVGSSIVVTFTKEEGNNTIGPELVSIQVLRGSTVVGRLTRHPLYDKETPNGPDCAYCTYASEPLEIID